MDDGREVYLDNAGSTKVSKAVLEAMEHACEVDYANPSAIHKSGVVAFKGIENAKDIIAKALNCGSDEIIFTSGGTESNNMAILGSAHGSMRMGNHVITTKIEHASVKNSVLQLENEGFELSFVNVNKEGYVDLDELRELIRPETVLVSVMYVNNEIGTIQDLTSIGKLIKDKNPNTLFHVDAVQAFAKYPIDVKKSKIDLLSLSGHKIHAPKGTGALYLKRGIKFKNVMFGGSQQMGYRPGTENYPGIVSLGKATEEMLQMRNEIQDKLRRIKSTMFDMLNEKIEGVHLNGPCIQDAATHILNIHIDGIKAAILINALSEDGVYVSAGSACSAKSKNASGTLIAIGLSKPEIESSLRISFSRFTEIEDIEYVTNKIKEHVEKIRKVSGYTK